MRAGWPPTGPECQEYITTGSTTSKNTLDHRRIQAPGVGLIFVKYISDTFAARRAELTARLSNPLDAYFFHEAGPGDIEAELEDRDHYKEVNAFWVPESARWEALRAGAKQVDIVKRTTRRLAAMNLAKPPFNISDWWHGSLMGDARWVYGDPPPGNAN